MLIFPIICVAFKVPRIHQTHATTYPAPKTGETPETYANRYVYDVDPSRDLAKQVDKIRWKIVNGYRAAAREKAGYHGDGTCGPEDGYRGKERTKRRDASSARNESYTDNVSGDFKRRKVRPTSATGMKSNMRWKEINNTTGQVTTGTTLLNARDIAHFEQLGKANPSCCPPPCAPVLPLSQSKNPY